MKFRNSGRIRHFGDHSGHIDLFFRSAVAFAASLDGDCTYNPRDPGTHRFPVFGLQMESDKATRLRQPDLAVGN